MDLEKLAFNKLTKDEQVKWRELADCVREYIDGNIYEEYAKIVNDALMNVSIGDHIAGYSTGNGYYYVTEGDYGELELEILTMDVDEIAFYILKNIYYLVSSDIELKNRTIYQKLWKYYHVKNTATNFNEWKKNPDYVYGTYYDPRKYVFESIICYLKEKFEGEWIEKVINEYQEYLNLWFEDMHWKYDEESQTYIEVSQSVDKRFKKVLNE